MFRNSGYLAILAGLVLGITMLGCGGGGGGGDEGGDQTASVTIGTAYSDSSSDPNAVHIGPTEPASFDTITGVTVEIYLGILTQAEADAATEDFTLSLNNTDSPPAWTGSIDGLPVDVDLTFVGRAVDAGANEIFTGLVSTSLTFGEANTVEIEMGALGVSFEFPKIGPITVPAEVKAGSTINPVEAEVFGKAGEDLRYLYTKDGGLAGAFNPSGVTVLPLSTTNGVATANYDDTAGSSAGTYTGNTLYLENDVGNSTTVDFSMTVVLGLGNTGVTTIFAPTVSRIAGSRSGSTVTWVATVSDDKTLPGGALDWSFEQNSGTSVTMATVSGNGVLSPYDDTVDGTVSLTVTDSDNLVTTVTFALVAGLFPDNVTLPLFNFDSGTLQGMTADGLWHVTTDKSASAPHSVWFGDEGRGDIKDTAAVAVNGDLTSPVIGVGDTAVLRFKYLVDNGCVPASGCITNRLQVFVSVNGATEVNRGDLADAPGAAFAVASIVLTGLNSGVNNTVQVRFNFTSASGDPVIVGPFIDDLRLTLQ